MAKTNHNKRTTISSLGERNEDVEKPVSHREVQQETMLASIKKDFRLSRVFEIIVALLIAIGIIGAVVSDSNDKECDYYRNSTQVPARCIYYFVNGEKK